MCRFVKSMCVSKRGEWKNMITVRNIFVKIMTVMSFTWNLVHCQMMSMTKIVYDMRYLLYRLVPRYTNGGTFSKSGSRTYLRGIAADARLRLIHCSCVARMFHYFWVLLLMIHAGSSVLRKLKRQVPSRENYRQIPHTVLTS